VLGEHADKVKGIKRQRNGEMKYLFILILIIDKFIKDSITYLNCNIIMGNARRIWINFLLYSD